MKDTTFAYEMIRIKKRCVMFNKYARNFNFHNEMKTTVTLSHTHAVLCLPQLHETHQACIYIQSVTGGTEQIREVVPYVKLYRYNPKHLCPKLNGFRDNGK